MHIRRVGALAGVLLTLFVAPQAAPAGVSFTWVPTTGAVEVGETVDLQLWAYSDATVNFNAAQAVLAWDVDLLTLTGLTTPPYPPPPDTSVWTSSFPFGDSFGLNEAAPLPLDGNGLWVGEVAIGRTWPITSAGLLLTTFHFLTTAPGDATVQVLSSLQLPGRPRALSKVIVGTSNALTNVGPVVTITIAGAPSPLFFQCMTGPDVSIPPAGCEEEDVTAWDFDLDGDFDLHDFAAAQAAWTQ